MFGNKSILPSWPSNPQQGIAHCNGAFVTFIALPETVRQNNKATLTAEGIASYRNRSPPKLLGACYSHTIALFEHALFPVC